MSQYDLATAELLPASSKVDLPKRELLTPLPDDGHYLMVIDNSSLEKIKRCHMAGGYYLFFSREGHAHTAALGFGSAIHIGLDLMERGADDLTIATAIIKYFTDNPQPPDEYRTCQTALEVMAHYRERRRLPDYNMQVLSDDDGLLIERPFELPLGVLEVATEIQLPSWDTPRRVDSIHVAWSGRMDLGARINEYNRVVDNKTTKIAGDQFVQGFQLSSQTLGYVWAARQLWPEHDFRGFCLNAIHLKKPSPGRSLLEKGPRGGECPLNFFRAYFEYSPERVSQWADDTIVLIEDWVHSLTRQQFPLNDRHCFDKYGRCPYFDCCSIDDKEVRLRMLLSDAYKDVTWSPTNER